MRQSIASNLPGTVSLGVSDVQYNHGTGIGEKQPTGIESVRTFLGCLASALHLAHIPPQGPVNTDFVWDEEVGSRSRSSAAEE